MTDIINPDDILEIGDVSESSIIDPSDILSVGDAQAPALDLSSLGVLPSALTVEEMQQSAASAPFTPIPEVAPGALEAEANAPGASRMEMLGEALIPGAQFGAEVGGAVLGRNALLLAANANPWTRGALGLASMAKSPAAQRVARAGVGAIGEGLGFMGASNLVREDGADLKDAAFEAGLAFGFDSYKYLPASVMVAGRGAKAAALGLKNAGVSLFRRTAPEAEILVDGTQKLSDQIKSLLKAADDGLYQSPVADIIGRNKELANERSLIAVGIGASKDAAKRDGVLSVPPREVLLGDSKVKLSGEIPETLVEKIDSIDARGLIRADNAKDSAEILNSFILSGDTTEAGVAKLSKDIQNLQFKPNTAPEQYLTGRGVVTTNLSEAEAALAVRGAQLLGINNTPGRVVERSEIPLHGLLGQSVEKISKIKEAQVSIGDIARSMQETIGPRLSTLGGAEQGKDSVRRVLERETDSLLSLGLSKSEMTYYQAARKEIAKKNKAFEIASNGQYSLIDPATGRINPEIPRSEVAKFFDSARGLKDFEKQIERSQELLNKGLSAKIPFADLYKNRIALDSKARFAPKETSSDIIATYTDLANSHRDIIDAVAQAKAPSDLATEFFENKKEASDILAVLPVIQGTAAEKRMEIVGAPGGISFGLTAILRTALAQETRGNAMALTRANMARGLTQEGTLGMLSQIGGFKLGPVPVGSAVAIPSQALKMVWDPISDKLTNSPSALQKVLSDMTESGLSGIQAKDALRVTLGNVVRSSIVIQSLEGMGITNIRPEDAPELLNNPEVQRILQEADQIANSSVEPLIEAAESGDPQVLDKTYSSFRKAFPDKSIFDPTKSGLVGEVERDGESRLPLEEDQIAYRNMLRDRVSRKKLSNETAAEAFKALNQRGAVTVNIGGKKVGQPKVDLSGSGLFNLPSLAQPPAV